jgi:hypothetical protein
MPVGFEEFWRLYPHKIGKLAAEEAYQRAIRQAPIDRIRNGARKFAEYCRDHIDPKYVPEPATWLNKGRWDDEPMTINYRVAGFAPQFPPDDYRPPERPRELNWARCFVPAASAEYPKMVDRATDSHTDPREYRYDDNGIWVSFLWLHD